MVIKLEILRGWLSESGIGVSELLPAWGPNGPAWFLVQPTDGWYGVVDRGECFEIYSNVRAFSLLIEWADPESFKKALDFFMKVLHES